MGELLRLSCTTKPFKGHCTIPKVCGAKDSPVACVNYHETGPVGSYTMSNEHLSPGWLSTGPGRTTFGSDAFDPRCLIKLKAYKVGMPSQQPPPPPPPPPPPAPPGGPWQAEFQQEALCCNLQPMDPLDRPHRDSGCCVKINTGEGLESCLAACLHLSTAAGLSLSPFHRPCICDLLPSM